MHTTPFGEKNFPLDYLAISIAECLVAIKFCIFYYILYKENLHP